MPGIPEHGLFDKNRYDGGKQRNASRHVDLFVIAGKNGFDAGNADTDPRSAQNEPEDHGSKALEPVVPVRVRGVGCFFGNAHADKRHKGGEHIGKRMHGVGNHGSRSSDDAGKKFENDQRDISDDPDDRHLPYNFLFVHRKHLISKSQNAFH